MKIEFCQDLQNEWVLENISFSNLSEVKIVLMVSQQEERPECVGRHGKDILTWPSIYRESKPTEFYFKNCVFFNIRDDIAPGFSENDTGEGKTFQRLLESELLRLHSDRGIDKLIHYRIVSTDEIIDVLCHDPPDIIRK